MIFTGEGPNACTCGHELPGTAHWSDDRLPFTTCPACGLHYVLEGDEVAIYASVVGGGVDLVQVAS